MEIIRALQGQIITCVGVLVTLALLSGYIRRTPEVSQESKKIVTRVWLGLSLLVIFVFGWFVLTFMSVNNVPRQVIDRDLVEKQADQFKNR